MDSLSRLPHVFTESGQQEAVFYVGLAATLALTITLILLDRAEKPRSPDGADAEPQPPVAFHDLSDPPADSNLFQLPIWATHNQCGGCGRRFVEDSFLCSHCADLVGRARVHHVFEVIEQGHEGKAWFLASALIRDVQEFRLHAASN